MLRWAGRGQAAQDWRDGSDCGGGHVGTAPSGENAGPPARKPTRRGCAARRAAAEKSREISLDFSRGGRRLKVSGWSTWSKVGVG